MAKKSGNGHRGVLEGVGKSFVGYTESLVLSAEEQGVVATLKGNDLARRQSMILEKQGDRASHEASMALTEIQGMRSDIGDAARALQASQWAAMETNDRLSSIGTALEAGLPDISKRVGDLQVTTEQLIGVPSSVTSVDSIVSSQPNLESEIIILALDGALKPEQKRALFDSMPYWKKDILDSGLIYKHDAKMEKTLSPEEKLFLTGLRRKARSSISSFHSIEVLAHNQLLDRDFHFNLSKTVAVARTGMVGLVHAANSLEAQGRERISQGEVAERQRDRLAGLLHTGVAIGAASLETQRKTNAGVDKLVDISGQSLVEQRATRISSQKTAENTHAIARGVAAQVILTQYYGHRAEGQRDVQIGISRDIESNTRGTERNTRLLAVFAERGNQISREIADNTGRLVELTEVSTELLGSVAESSRMTAMSTASIAESSDITATNTTSMARDMGSLVDFADRAEYAREIMVEQDRVRNLVLKDMAGSLDTANFYHALTREEIAGLHLTIIQGIDLARQIGIRQIIEATRTNDLLTILIEMVRTTSEQLISSLEKMDENMERRHQTELEVRSGEKFREGKGKYEKGKIAEAIAKFNESIKLWGNDHRVYFYRGLCNVLSDRPEDARRDFEEALTWAVDAKKPAILAIIKMNLARLSYSESKAHGKKGNSEVSDQKMLDAILTAREACEIVPDSPHTAFALATYLAAYTLYDDARKILMRIIPKDPTLLQKMLMTPEFGPILDSFQHAFKESERGSSTEITNDTMSVAIMKDCMEIGDFPTALYCTEELMKGGSIQLLRLKIWGIEALKPIRKQIIDVITRAIDAAGQSNDSQNCYGVAMLGLHCRENQSEISNSQIFDVFLAGTKCDLDVDNKNKTAMLKKLNALSETGMKTILSINALHRNGLEWLN